MRTQTHTTFSRTWTVILCWFTVALEGFDLVALGATTPILTDPAAPHAGLTTETMTVVATLSLVGVGLGAVMIGPLSYRWGRRRTLLACVALFSIFTIAIPLLPTWALIALFRFIAGLGLGASMPVALTVMQETMASGRRAHATTVTMTGYHAGAVGASLVALAVADAWQWVFYIGGGLGIIVLPLIYLYLPDHSSAEEADASASAEAETKPGITALFSNGRARSTIAMWVASFMGLLLVYGLNQWLPKIMVSAGYPVADSLVMLFVTNVGAVIGLLIGGATADRFGARGSIAVWFLLAAVFLLSLVIRFNSGIVLNAFLLITGVFVFSAQVMIYGLVGYIYPAHLVSTGMGMTAGIGRFGAIIGPAITGWMISTGNGYPGVFIFYAAAALLAVVMVLLIRKPEQPSAKRNSSANRNSRETMTQE